MFIEAWLKAAPYVFSIAFVGWLVSLILRDVSIVDGLWSLMILVAGAIYYFEFSSDTVRNILVLSLLALWGLRLSLYIYVRNHGKGEDRRYQKIRKNNSPGFVWKSLYIVFGLQALLAWIISFVLVPVMASDLPLNYLGYFACLLWLIGFAFEVIADFQLAQFQKKRDSENKVLNTGLWRYSRHPNYFGEFCIWWGFYFFAAASGAWWTVFSPLIMSILLLRVSGVVMLERDIAERRPEYEEYIATTNAFFPGLPKQGIIQS